MVKDASKTMVAPAPLGISASRLDGVDAEPRNLSEAVQEPAPEADPLKIVDNFTPQANDPYYGQGGAYKIDEATGKRVPV